MKALTVWQPWASLIAIEAKPYEFRSWPPPSWIVGKRIAIHAGARPPRLSEVSDLINRLMHDVADDEPCLHRAPALTLLRKLQRGLVEAKKPTLAANAFRVPLCAIVATAVVGAGKRGDLCAAEFGRAAGNDSYRAGTFNWGWPLSDVQVVMPPIEAIGAQGLWDARIEADA